MIDTYHRPGPICPHCGHDFIDDAWEWLPDGGNAYGDPGTATRECGRCGKPFTWERHVTVSYSTFPPHQKGGGQP